jgi:phosphoribosylglycinamide formyltransferase-1
MDKVKLAIFVSGSGSNCENLITYFRKTKTADIVVVVSNRSDAYALTRAQRLQVPAEVVNKAQLNDPEVMKPLLNRYQVDMIVLAGFLPMVPDYLIDLYPKRIINIHPALLPKHGGKGMWGHHVHEAVKAAGDTETGITVHYVSPVCDGGEIIAQRSVQITSDDTVEDIAAKEHELEMRFFPEIVEQVILGLK